MHFNLNCILSETAPYKFSVRVYKDDEEAATILEEEFAKLMKEKFQAELEDFESLDKGFVFDLILQEASNEDAFKFYKELKHVRAENSDNIFPGYTFNAFFRLPVDAFEQYADDATNTFNDAKEKLGASEAHQNQFPDVKALLDKLRPSRGGPKIRRDDFQRGGNNGHRDRDNRGANKKDLNTMGFGSSGGGPKMFFNKHKEVEI